MKTENYPKNNGTSGTKYTLEKGDVIEPVFSKPRESSLSNSNYLSYSIKAVWNNKEIFVSLTKGQYKRLMGLGDLNGKKLIAVGYQGESCKELIGLNILE